MKYEKPYIVSKKILDTVKRFLTSRKLYLGIQSGFSWPNTYATRVNPKKHMHTYLKLCTVKESFDDSSLKLSSKGVSGLNVDKITPSGTKDGTEICVIPLNYNIDKLKDDILTNIPKEENIDTLLSVARELQITIDIMR